MAHAYTPGLQVKDQIRYRARRLLPIPGEVLVQKGEQVLADQVIAKTDQPGNVYPVNLANHLAISAGDVPGAMNFQVGDSVQVGDQLAISKGIFGLFRNAYSARVSGTIESVSHITGQVIIRGEPIPVQVDAFVTGSVIEIIPGEGAIVETAAAYLQGIFGIGGETKGRLQILTTSPEKDLVPGIIGPEQRGAIVVGGRRIHGDTVARAREIGVAAIIGGGIDDQDLKEILGYDLGVAITGSEQIDISLIITEGFGEVAMANKTFELLSKHNGMQASVNGATQIRAGVLRPEIVIPLPSAKLTEETARRVGGGVLEVGSHVRLIRDPYFGILGTVTDLPSDPQILDSGSKARILAVQCQSGERVIVPRANVELVGDQ